MLQLKSKFRCASPTHVICSTVSGCLSVILKTEECMVYSSQSSLVHCFHMLIGHSVLYVIFLIWCTQNYIKNTFSSMLNVRALYFVVGYWHIVKSKPHPLFNWLSSFLWPHLQSQQASKSLGPYLKGIDLHLPNEITCILCVLQKSLWSTPRRWWAAQRNQQVSTCSLHLAHKHHCFMRGTKTYILIFLDLSFKVWNEY